MGIDNDWYVTNYKKLVDDLKSILKDLENAHIGIPGYEDYFRGANNERKIIRRNLRKIMTEE